MLYSIKHLFTIPANSAIHLLCAIQVCVSDLRAPASSRVAWRSTRKLGAYEAPNLTGAETIDTSDARPPAQHERNTASGIIGLGRPATQQRRRHNRARVIQIDLYEQRASGPLWRARWSADTRARAQVGANVLRFDSSSWRSIERGSGAGTRPRSQYTCSSARASPPRFTSSPCRGPPALVTRMMKARDRRDDEDVETTRRRDRRRDRNGDCHKARDRRRVQGLVTISPNSLLPIA